MRKKNHFLLKIELKFQSNTLIHPKLPLGRKETAFKGYSFEYYDYNGWIYTMESGEYLICVAAAPPCENDSAENIEESKFLLTARGPNFSMQTVE